MGAKHLAHHTECARGHSYSQWGRMRDGGRFCVLCSRARTRISYQRARGVELGMDEALEGVLARATKAETVAVV